MNRRFAIVLFVLLAAADVVLLAVVMRDARSTPTVSDLPPVTAAPSTAPTGAAKVNGRASLALSEDGLVARLIRGRCTADGKPRLDISADGAQTFEEIALPVQSGRRVRTLLAIRMESDSDLTVIAGDRECKSTAFRTRDRGDSWEEVDRPGMWFVDASGTEVTSPSRSSDPGCDVLSVSPLSERNAKVLCEDGGVIRGTDNGGDDWVTLGELGEATAGTFWDLRLGLAIAPVDGCKSQAFETRDAGSQWSGSGCVARSAEVSSVVGTPGRLYALAGSRVLTSTDGGETWKRTQE